MVQDRQANMPLTPEAWILLRIARAAISEQDALVDELPDFDWLKLCTIARRHQLSPFLYQALAGDRCKDRPPEALFNALKQEYYRTRLRNKLIQERIAPILHDLTRGNVDCMLLKGAVLAYSTYERAELRWLGDVDLLVRELDFPAIREILESHHYGLSLPEIRGRDLPRYAHCIQQIRFISNTPPPIEVHFRLINTGMPAKQEPAWDEAVPHDFCGVKVLRPSAEWFLLHLCFHAQQHAFSILRLFMDIACWSRANPMDDARFEALARRQHLAATAYYALTYTAELLGAAGMETLQSRLEPGIWKRRLFEALWRDRKVRALLANASSEETQLPRLFLLGEAPLPAKMLFLWHVAFPPGKWLSQTGGTVLQRRLRHIGRVAAGALHSLMENADSSK